MTLLIYSRASILSKELAKATMFGMEPLAWKSDFEKYLVLLIQQALDENEDEIEPQKEGKSLKIEEGGESLVNTEQLQKHKPKEKSLGIIAFNFLKLLQKENTLTIENAAEILSRNLEPNKFKTKV